MKEDFPPEADPPLADNPPKFARGDWRRTNLDAPTITGKMLMDERTPKPDIQRVGEQINFDSDRERLKFFRTLVGKRVRGTQEIIDEEYNRFLQGKDPLKQSREIMEEKSAYQERYRRAAFEALDALQREVVQGNQMARHQSEIVTLIETVRATMLAQKIVRYKEYQLMEGAPALTEDEIKEQNRIRESITETRALLRWHLLQYDENPEYIRRFLEELHVLLSQLVLSEKFESFRRGFAQELGMHKLLKKYFRSVIPATPKEDAHYAIDFWVVTKSGKKIMLASQSKSLFGKDGVFTEEQIRKLREKVEQEPDATTQYSVYEEEEGDIEHIPRLVQAKRLERDVQTAKEYAGAKGIAEPQFFLVVAQSGYFEYPSGESKPGLSQPLQRQLERLSKS